MRGIVFQGEGRWALEARPMPLLAADDDVLLKIDSASICGTDLHILSVPPGHPATPGSILGHEYVATVEQVGSAANGLASGDRVVVDPNLTCGLCQSCRTGQTNCCENMTTLGIYRNGGLAEFNVAPAKALHKISRRCSSRASGSGRASDLCPSRVRKGADHAGGKCCGHRRWSHRVALCDALQIGRSWDGDRHRAGRV